ncbi:hypothetical protein K435DRAFT_779739 [Dendrothele bispora CBS 962.96]|uniref:Uncharacterized protein n=1 Tax=Dendrothele bispora (strain CBS 962.96) TaxID=1314807 RepID=A0A4S8LVK1_DENBC|nr:hypothetical protein K435DRAFT_784884 [Dendrothele bispora CBS 962.96]THU93676.1 hypothetical protein K435DRAFT_779739 [Dendrothele bispora CBS 962.96]
MGGGGQYPYPKTVWTPAGGWWVRPSNWRTNTAVFSSFIALTVYGFYQFTSAREVRYTKPAKELAFGNYNSTTEKES